ncbi:unnamed protein product [Closterium sp. NIES-54]
MYALSASAKGDCSRCVPPDPRIAAAALGASESGTLPGLHLPSIVTTTTPGGQRVLICTCTRTGRHLNTFNRRPGSNLYTLATEIPQVAASAQVSTSGQVAASCSCRLLSHQTLLWHHRLGHPSLPRLRGMHSQFLISGLPRSLPPLPPSPTPPCLPCVEGRQRAAPHSSSFPQTTAPLQTLHMDVWGPACVSGQGRERYFLLVVDDYTRYTTVFPLRSKGEVVDVLIPWIRTVRLQLRGRFSTDLPVLRLHFDRGASPQQNGIAEHRIGLVMEVARTSMIHAPLLPQGPAPSGVSQVDPLPGTAPVQVAVSSGAAQGAASGGAASGGAEPGGAGSEGAGSGGTEPEGVEPGGAESEGAESGGAAPRGVASSGGAGDTEAGDAAVTTEAGGTGGTAAIGPRGARTTGAGAAGTGGVGCVGAGDRTEPGAAGAGGAGVGGDGVGVTGAGGAGGAGGTVRPRPYFVPLLQQVLGVPSSTGLPHPFLCPQPEQSQLPLQPASPLAAPSPYTEQSGGLSERREPASCPLLPVCTARRAPRSHPPPVPGTHALALRPSSVPLRIPLPAPSESSLPPVPDPASDRARAASPALSRLLATAVTDPFFESAATSALVAELLDFAAACRLDYASALVADSVSSSPPSVGGECALGTNVLEDRHEDFECLAAALPRFASMLLAPEGDPDAPDIPTPRSYAEAITGPYSSQWQAAMDAEMASWKSTGTYVDEVPPSRANIVHGMWIFRVKRPPGSPPAFKARYIARGFSQR